MSRMGPVRIALVLWLATAMLAACNRQPEPDEAVREDAATTARPADDGSVTTSVQARLYTSEEARGSDIDVNTTDGVVTLSGSVESDAARERAIAIARATEGVTRVEDRLMVRTDGQERADAGGRPDDTVATTGRLDENPGWITTKIQAQYFVDPEIKPWNIDVTTMSGGVVTLSGEVDSAQDRTKAVQLARNTEGVTRVVDDLRVRSEQPQARGSEADGPGAADNTRADSDAGQFSDPWLTTKLQSKYFLDPDVRGLAIDVTTENGTVTLRGDVETEAERRQAVAIARNTDGVRDVRDELRLRPASDQARAQDTPAPRGTTGVANTTGDAWITTKIQSKYFLDADVKGHEINIDTRNGVVTLNGSVESAAAMREAEQIARETEGVTRVVNRLSVEPAQARAQ